MIELSGAPVESLIEYELFIPLSGKAGQKPQVSALNGFKKQLADFFGGLTITNYKNEGVWKVGNQTVRDEIQMWRVLSTKSIEGDKFMKRIRSNIEETLSEELILIVRREVTQI